MTIGVPLSGTRTAQTAAGPAGAMKRAPQQGYDRTLNTDKGLSKNVTAAITFVNGATKQAQGAGGTFANFAAGDRVLVEGTNLNNGEFDVISTDASTQLTLDPSPKNEGPLTATIRAV